MESGCGLTQELQVKCLRLSLKKGINIQLITTSEIKISVVIEEKYLELAVRSLHSTFDLGDPNFNGEGKQI